MNMALEVVLLIVQLFLNQVQIIFDMVLDKQIVKIIVFDKSRVLCVLSCWKSQVVFWR